MDDFALFGVPAFGVASTVYFEPFWFRKTSKKGSFPGCHVLGLGHDSLIDEC